MTRKLVDVSAGVLLRPDGCYLLGQRAQDTVYAGYWEFPGGKVEPGETPAQALCRELDEELGIRVTHLRPWLRREHVYEHAHVRLHFFEIAAWEGELDDRVHSALAWVQPDGPTRAPDTHARWNRALPPAPALGAARAQAPGRARRVARPRQAPRHG